MISPLRQSDEMIVRDWARDYLAGYLRHVSLACGAPLTDAALSEHIARHDLVGALWHDLVHADSGADAYVAVARQGNLPVGLILVEQQIEPYLRLPIGLIRWIYVAPEARRRGLSSELLAAARQWMEGRHLRATEAIIPAGHADAAAFYSRSGFSAVERRLATPLSAPPARG